MGSSVLQKAPFTASRPSRASPFTGQGNSARLPTLDAPLTYSSAMPAASARFQAASPMLATASLIKRLPVRRGVMKNTAAKAALVSQPKTRASTKAGSTVARLMSMLMPRPSGTLNENFSTSGKSRSPAARIPSVAAASSHRMATTRKRPAALSGALWIRVRLRFGGWSYGRSFRVISAGSALRALSCVGNETGSP